MGKDFNNRLVAINAFDGVDIAISVFSHRIGLQKIINRPGVNHFRTIIRGTVPDWLEVGDDPVAIDNFYGEELPGRVAKADLRRDVVSSQKITAEDNVTYIDQWVQDKVYAVDPATRVRYVSEDIVYPVRLHVNYNVQLVRGGGNDEGNMRGESDDTTLLGTGLTTLRIGTNAATGDQIVGIIFDLVVPQGATISDATLTVYPTSTDSSTITWTIYADDNLNQGDWGASDRPSQVTATTASVDVVNPSTTANTAFDIDVTSIVQEIVNDGSWTSGNVIRFVCEHDQTSGYTGRFVHSANAYASAGLQPELDVNYTVGGGGGTPISAIAYNQLSQRKKR